MQKLLTKYTEDRSIENATKVYEYNNKHPMASCMLSSDEFEVLRAAQLQYRQAKYNSAEA